MFNETTMYESGNLNRTYAHHVLTTFVSLFSDIPQYEVERWKQKYCTFKVKAGGP